MRTHHLKTALGVTALILALALTGCESNDKVYVCDVDVTPPATPRGVYSITGNEAVTIVWLGSDEQDLAGYRVWRSDFPEGPYNVIADIEVDDLPLQLQYTDRHNLRNGDTYFYAVTSYDYEGNESELSYEDVFDTPRPEGFGVRLYALQDEFGAAGFDFSRHVRVSAGDNRADIIITLENGTFYVEAVDDPDVRTDIQDFGYTETLDAVDWAPDMGWSELGWAEIILGHSYIVWTRDNHYAKFRVIDIRATSIVIDWAWQVDPGNPELKPALPSRDNTVAMAESQS
jgi:hypothetical protein